jgi:hypothetical protein
MTQIEQLIQIGMTAGQLRPFRTLVDLALPTGHRRHGGYQTGESHSLMKAGMTIFLGWFVGGLASAILHRQHRDTRARPDEPDTHLTSIRSPWDRSMPTSDARGMPCG